ncbi:MAG: hypothetical protein ACYCW6_31255 [Candidatus Xenobia bacterium]
MVADAATASQARHCNAATSSISITELRIEDDPILAFIEDLPT